MIVAYVRFTNDGRKLKNSIQGLLKSGLVQSITRINYAKSYTLQEGKVVSNQEKVLLINLPKENKEKFSAFLKKNNPTQSLEILIFSPEA